MKNYKYLFCLVVMYFLLIQCVTIEKVSNATKEVATNVGKSITGSKVDLTKGISNTTAIQAGTYYLINVGSSKALALPKKEKFRVLQMEKFDGNDLQKWEVSANKNGTYKFKAFDTPNWHMYFVNTKSLAVNSDDVEHFKIVAAKTSKNYFHLVPSKYGGKALIWDGSDTSYGTQVEILQNNKFDQWILLKAN